MDWAAIAACVIARTSPVRGQRTHTNARTRKGPAKAIAGKKKVTKQWPKQQPRRQGAGCARKKEKKNVVVGVAHVAATFNNTIVTITDPAAMPSPGRPPA
jgi:hypothetical protein